MGGMGGMMGGMGGMMGGMGGGMPGMPGAARTPPPAPPPLVDEPERALRHETFASMEDISPEGNRSALKTLLARGDGSRNRPEAGAVVRVHFVGRTLSGAVFDSSWDRAREKMKAAGAHRPSDNTPPEQASNGAAAEGQAGDEAQDEDYELQLDVLKGRLSHLKRSELVRRATEAGATGFKLHIKPFACGR